MYRPACNITNQPLVVDDDGHVLAGQEWGAVDEDSERIHTLVEVGALVLPAVESIGDEANDDAKGAKTESERLNAGAQRRPARSKPEPEAEVK